MTLINEEGLQPLTRTMLNFGDETLRKLVIDSEHAANYADRLGRMLDTGDEDAALFGDYIQASDDAVNLWDAACARYRILTQ